MKLVLIAYADTSVSIQIDGDASMIGSYKYSDEIDQKYIAEVNKLLIKEIKSEGINYNLEVCES